MNNTSSHSKQKRILAGLLVTIQVFFPFAKKAEAAAVSIADEPVTASINVPPNLMFTLSVEWPTGVVAAYNDNASTDTGFACPGRDNGVGVCYFADRNYLGYFDPMVCYTYDSTNKYFYPSAKATPTHGCTGKWSGNYLNWVSMHALDEFRFALTGGDRVTDTTTDTVIEKSLHTGAGGYDQFPIKRIRSTAYSGGTPTVPGVAPSTVSPQNWAQMYARVTNGTTPLAISGDTASTGRVLQVSDNSGFLGSSAAPANITGRYVMVRLDSPSQILSLAEVQVFDNSNTPVNIALNRTTSASSVSTQWGSRNTSEAVDGSTDGSQYTHTNTDAQAWLQIDLGSSKTISNIVVWGRTDCCQDRLSNVNILVSDTSMSNSSLASLLSNSSVTKYYFSGQQPIPFQTGGQTLAPMYVRVKACDPNYPPSSVSRITCTAYGSSSTKPTGLIQQNASRMRFGATSYLNTDGSTLPGGVVRSAMKYVGPVNIVPNGTNTNNSASEINDSGLQPQNPDNASTPNSGVINYINRFGKPSGVYKSTDVLSEMVYEATRYIRNLPATAAFTNGQTIDDSAAGLQNKDGFPVITNWNTWNTGDVNKRPIQYWCQKNYFVGIADSNTHKDTYVPGNTYTTAANHNPGSLTDENGINITTLDNEIGVAEGYNSGSTTLATYSPGRGSTFHAAGLAWWMHSRDILPDDAAKPWTIGRQSVSTYWVDVRETGSVAPKSESGTLPYNQMWQAAKYGGYDDARTDQTTNRNLTTNPLTEAEWKTNSGVDPDNYFKGSRPDLLIDAFTNIFQNINDRNASSIGGALSTQNLTTAGAEYDVQFNIGKWTGDVTGKTITAATDGSLSTTKVWSAQTKLEAQNWDTNRKIVSFNGSTGVPFRLSNASPSANLTAIQLSYLGSDATARGNLINYIRGDRTNEGSTYRTRSKLLGDIINSQAVYVSSSPDDGYLDSYNPGFSTFVSTTIPALNSGAGRKPAIYVGANDGMLHAFNASVSGTDAGNGGTEFFAYIPSFVLSGPSSPATPSINGLASRAANGVFTHKYLVDQTPVIASVDFARTGTAPSGGFPSTTTSNWKTLLVAGLNKGGRGIYALDITNPAATNEADAASKVLWEFTDDAMGFTFGQPIIVKTDKYGWVVLVTSGYNNTYGSITADKGKGFLYVLNARTGRLLERIGTGVGNEASPSGFTYITAFVPNYKDRTAKEVYGGDLNGNLWRFDLSLAAGSTDSYPNPIKIAELKDASGTVQPITTPPKVEIDPNLVKRWVFVGTGRLFDTEDLATTGVQSFYAFRDGTVTASYTSATSPVAFPINARTSSVQLTDLLTGITPDTTKPMGWYYDLPVSGTDPAQRITAALMANEGTIGWIARTPSSDACSPGATSSIYAVDYGTGITRLVNSSGALIASSTSTTLVTGIFAYRYGSKIGIGFNTGNPADETGTLKGNWNNFSGTPVRVNWREIVQ